MWALRLCSRIRDEEAACVAQVELQCTGACFNVIFLYHQPIVEAIYREMSLRACLRHALTSNLTIKDVWFHPAVLLTTVFLHCLHAAFQNVTTAL